MDHKPTVLVVVTTVVVLFAAVSVLMHGYLLPTFAVSFCSGFMFAMMIGWLLEEEPR